MNIDTLIICIGFLVSISPLLMEPLEPKYVTNTHCAKARQLLLLKWIVATFFVAMSYKQVLLVYLVDTGYEKPIESLEELVSSGKPLAAPINSNCSLTQKTLTHMIQWS